VHPYEETFVVLAGRMAFTPDGGTRRALGPGDMITIPAGSTNVIEVIEPVRKMWAITADEPLDL
jgi:uncharacterized cupin superfamily protein